MFSDLIHKVADHQAKNLPFVVYRKPKDQTVRAIFQKNAQLLTTHNFEETGFVFAPFDANNLSVLIPIDAIFEGTYEPKNIQNAYSEKRLDDTSQKSFHINLVHKGISQIKSGEFKKVVLSRVLEAKCDTAPLVLFQRLLDRYNSAFCYLWYHPKVGIWLGATPEILLKTENRRLTTMSLAGTKKHVEGHLPEWGAKEIKEQQLVTNYISNTLGNTVSNINIAERASVKAGNLWHLRTKITATFEQSSFANIIDAMHPTPAVCGLPMVATKDFILTHEGYDREFYTGYLGELNFKEKKDRASNQRNQENKAYRSIKTTTTLFVNLRCMQLKPSQAKIYIGGGITEDSDAIKEWDETVAKSETMLCVL